ncbi:MAG: response regulator [Candidatus Omnitrophica bacterium]|nr:response regulator [Candidatus Omnitrophota bacterium]
MTNILIVDDERKIRSVYSGLLKGEGYETCEASNVADAYEMLKKRNIDLVLLDIKMPEIDGGEMYDIIQLFHRKTRVIVASVCPLTEQKRMIEGADGYYDKSYGIEELLLRIKEVLDNGSTGNSFL